VTVITADGEEGYAHVTQLLCDKPDCFERVRAGVQALGFVTHHHGGIDYLEDTTCCGGVNAYKNCPHPTPGGEITITKKVAE